MFVVAPALAPWTESAIGSLVQYDFCMGIKWLLSNIIFSYQRRNRAGRIGFVFVSIGILGMLQRVFMQSPTGAFGGIPAAIFILGVFFSVLGWVLSIIYPQRRI